MFVSSSVSIVWQTFLFRSGKKRSIARMSFSSRVPKEHCRRPYCVATTSACGSEVQKPVDVSQVQCTQDPDLDDYFHRREHSNQLSSSRQTKCPSTYTPICLVLGEQSNVCFQLPIKRDLMALVRAQEKAMDFKRLRCASRLQPRVCSWTLLTDFCCRAGTPPTYGVRIRTYWSRQKCLQRPLLIRRPVSKSHLWQCRERSISSVQVDNSNQFSSSRNPDVLLVQHIDEIIKVPLEQEVREALSQEWVQQRIVHQIDDVLVPPRVEEIGKVPSERISECIVANVRLGSNTEH